MTVKVIVRVRPLNEREKKAGAGVAVRMEKDATSLLPPPDAPPDASKHDFFFDHSYWSIDKEHANYCTQQTLFESVGKAYVQDCLAGYNCSVFAYGQTGAGKSYSMMGYGEDEGLIPLSMSHLYECIQAAHATAANDPLKPRFEVEISYLELYNERITDLLSPGNKATLKLRESKTAGVYVQGLTMVACGDYHAFTKVLSDGNKARTVASTKMNATSSRSHAVLTVHVKNTSKVEGSTKPRIVKSKVHLVDLAGSERQTRTGAKGKRLREACAINKSLSALGNVISALADMGEHGKKDVHVPYRDSTLTRILQNSLGGNAKTFMIAAISPAANQYEETLSTLRYADRAKHIVNHATVNEDPDSKLVRELREEVATLKQELSKLQMPRAETPGGTKNTRAVKAAMAKRAALEDDMEMALSLANTLEMGWDDKLKQALAAQTQREQALRQMGIDVDDPHGPQLINLNEDPSLSGVLVYGLRAGETSFGRRPTAKELEDEHPSEEVLAHVDVPLVGPSIALHHCTFVNEKNVVTLLPQPGARTFVNGIPVERQVLLVPGARIVLGNHHIFRYTNALLNKTATATGAGAGATEEAVATGGSTSVPPTVVDWEFAAKELATALGEMAQLKDDADRKLEAKKDEAAKAEGLLRSELERVEGRLEHLQEEVKRKEAEVDALKQAVSSGDDPDAKEELDLASKELDTLHERSKRKEAELAAKSKRIKEAAAKNSKRLMGYASKIMQHTAALTRKEQDMMKMLQLVHEATSLSHELGQDFAYSVVQRPFFDERLRAKKTQLDVLVSEEDLDGGMIACDLEAFTDRVDKMRELYDDYIEDGKIDMELPQDEDPFYMPTQQDLLGVAYLTLSAASPARTSAMLPIQSHFRLAAMGPNARQKCGDLAVEIICSPSLEHVAEQLLQQRGAKASAPPPNDIAMEITVRVVSASGLAEASEHQVMYRFLGREFVVAKATADKGVKTTKPRFDHTATIKISKVDHPLLKYLKHIGVYFECWANAEIRSARSALAARNPPVSLRGTTAAAAAAPNGGANANGGVVPAAVQILQKQQQDEISKLRQQLQDVEREKQEQARQLERTQQSLQMAKQHEEEAKREVTALKKTGTTEKKKSSTCAIQ